MGSKYIVVAKYKDDDRIVMNMATASYIEALKTKNRLEGLGHIASIIDITNYK